jgi:hypothetical protein
MSARTALFFVLVAALTFIALYGLTFLATHWMLSELFW